MQMDERQSLAVNTVGTNILVSASAGAGKTRVLVERLLKRCLNDRVSLTEILAVTFTEAAAEEMKNRIARGLQERRETAASEEEKEYIRQQMILLADADITTIDSFCLNIIRKYYSVIGLDPARVNHVLDDSASERLHDLAFRKALAEYDAEHHRILSVFLQSVSPRPEDYTVLKKMVRETEKLCDQYGSEDEWLKPAEAAFRSIRSLGDLPETVRDSFFAALRLRYETICFHMNRMAETISESEKAMKKEKDLRLSQNLLLSCGPALNERNYDLFREMFLSFRADQKTPPGNDSEAYSRARDAMYSACGSLMEILYDSDILVQDVRDLVPFVQCLCSLTRKTIAEFRRQKQIHACMDFSDMEHFAWDILTANGNAVALLFRQRLKEVMVDEFQDTSLLQNQIIEAIAAPGTIFRVGDVKQSIYRFRGARPSLMRGLMHDTEIRNIVLSRNYRSKENIISFANVLFQKIMNIPGCEDSYEGADIVSPGTASQVLQTPDPVQLILLRNPSRDQEGAEDSDGEALSSKELKAAWIASEMISLHESGYDWKNLCVLVRSHSDKNVLRRMFEHCGIPSEIDTREGFFNSDLCRTVLALLKCLVTPDDDFSLLAVLTSELFEFDDETLAGLRIRHGSLRRGIRMEYPEIPEWFSFLRAKAKEGMTVLLDEICRKNGFYEKLPESQKANFDSLFEKTAAVSDGQSIYDLIDMMTSSDDEKSSSASSRSRDDDVVTVTTIHQSKGLQYKVVFLWSTGGNMLMDSKNELILDRDVFFGLKHCDLPWRTIRPTVFRIAAEYRQSLADLEEYNRVLYVALTRAEQKMYIVDTEDRRQPYRPDMNIYDLFRRKGITGLITSALTDIPDLFVIRTITPEEFRQIPMREMDYAEALPHYTGDASVLPLMQRPSQFELHSLPDLDLSGSERGTGYGTRMHEIIASLPDRTWTDQDLEPFDLSENDRRHLLAFSSGDLYQRALSGTIRKEMNFYVEDPERTMRMNGAMDFVSFLSDRILLIDFKTDNASLSEIRQRYRDQLNAYRTALNLMYPDLPVEVHAWSLHSDADLLF